MTKPYTIHVDLDAKCKRCGKAGAVETSGICMACVAKGVKKGEFDHILKKHRPTLKEK